MNSDIRIALALSVASLAMFYGLWRLVGIHHSGRILTGMGALSALLIVAPSLVPSLPREVVGVGFVLGVLVTFGVLFWRHRSDGDDWLDVATVRYVKPISIAERVGTAVVGLLLCNVIVGPSSFPLRARVLAAWLLPIAWYVVVRGRPPRGRSRGDAK